LCHPHPHSSNMFFSTFFDSGRSTGGVGLYTATSGKEGFFLLNQRAEPEVPGGKKKERMSFFLGDCCYFLKKEHEMRHSCKVIFFAFVFFFMSRIIFVSYIFFPFIFFYFEIGANLSCAKEIVRIFSIKKIGERKEKKKDSSHVYIFSTYNTGMKDNEIRFAVLIRRSPRSRSRTNPARSLECCHCQTPLAVEARARAPKSACSTPASKPRTQSWTNTSQRMRQRLPM